MKTIICAKKYRKASAEEKTAIRKSVSELYKRINSYKQQGTDFAHIFNDDKVKYDKHGKFFTFKSQKSNMQLRLLYSFLNVDGEDTVIIADYYIKKKDKKDYIKQFDLMNNCDPYSLLCFAVA